MDPDATLQLLLDAIYCKDLAAVREHGGDLGEHLFTAGAMPELPSDKLMVLVEALAMLATLAKDEGVEWYKPGDLLAEGARHSTGHKDA